MSKPLEDTIPADADDKTTGQKLKSAVMNAADFCADLKLKDDDSIEITIWTRDGTEPYTVSDEDLGKAVRQKLKDKKTGRIKRIKKIRYDMIYGK